MNKEFTINVPDEIWVNAWDDSNTETYTYVGPETIYVLISDRTDDVSMSSESEITVEDGNLDFVVEVDATVDANLPVAHWLHSQGTEIEHTFANETMHDGSVYSGIANPAIHDYFSIAYNRGDGVTIQPIYKNPTLENEVLADTRLAYVNKYANAYEFDDTVTGIITTFVAAIATYKALVATSYPWKFVTLDVAEVPKIPASLVVAFNAMPDPDVGV